MIHVLLLCTLGLLPPVAEQIGPAASDPMRLKEMLYDRQQPRQQSQAALLLVQDHSPDAEEVVRLGLAQTDSPDVFAALASALRLSRDVRFRDELFTALLSGQPAFRQAAAAALVEMMDGNVLQQLETILANPRNDVGARQAALWTLGRSGRKQAAGILLEFIAHPHEGIRRSAAEALTELTGRNYGSAVPRWREWWDEIKDQSNERWLESRADFQGSRLRRLETELERSKNQILRLQEQLYTRLPPADRLGHVLSLIDHEDSAVRLLAIRWCGELMRDLPPVGQSAVADLLLRFSNDGTAEVQRAAVLALGRVADSRALDRLLVLLKSGPPGVRAASARSLAQQGRGQSAEAKARQKVIVPALRDALRDTAVEVVVEAAEDLGSLGVPEAGPVLGDLLNHPSASVRIAASSALERMADINLLEELLQALDDPVVTVRFRLIGAIGHAVGDGRGLGEGVREQMLAKLELALRSDADAGVRSRAASVLGACGGEAQLNVLWRRVAPTEDSRVQEKAWEALLEILARSGNSELILEWDHRLAGEQQPQRRVALLSEICQRWLRRQELRSGLAPVQEALIPLHLDQGKWAAALPHVRDLLNRPTSDSELRRRLQWLHRIGEQALKDGQPAEAQRVCQIAQSHRDRLGPLATAFEQLERDASKEE